MSKHPFPWTPGQPRSLRASLYAKFNLTARMGAQVGIVSDQYAGLKAGAAVTLTTEQLVSFYPLGTEHPSLPAALAVADAWTLTGDDTLTAVES